MAKGYFDIETAEPTENNGGSLARTDREEQQRQQDTAEALRLKESIARGLEQGQEPQALLYTAVRVIGLLTNDPAFTEAAQARIDAVYKDLAQLSFTEDNDRKAQERLEKMQTEYRDKLRGSISRQLNANRRIEKALQEVLNAVDAAEPHEDILQ